MGKIIDALVNVFMKRVKIKVDTLKDLIDECDADGDGDIYLTEIWNLAKVKWFKFWQG